MITQNGEPPAKRILASAAGKCIIAILYLPLTLMGTDGVRCDHNTTQFIVPGDSTACELTAGGAQIFKFMGEQATSILVHAAADRGQPCIQLLDPNGRKTAEHCAGLARVSTVLSTSGIWSIQVSEYLGQALNYTLALEQFGGQNLSREIGFGQMIEDRLEPAGDLDRYDFKVPAPTNVLARCGLSGGMCCLEVRDSRSTVLAEQCANLADVRTNLPAAGSYSLLLYDYWNGERPSYTLTLDSVAPSARAVAIEPGKQLAATFKNLVQAHMYEFRGLGRSVITLRAFAPKPTAGSCIELHDSQGRKIAQDCSQQETWLHLTLPHTGTYIAVLTPYSEQMFLPLDYTISLSRIFPPTSGERVLSFGQGLSSVIESFGDDDLFVFKGTRNDMLTIDVAAADVHHSIGFTLFDPYGAARRVVGGRLRLPHTGTYTLMVSEGSYIASGRPFYPRIDYTVRVDCSGVCFPGGMTIGNRLEFPLGVAGVKYPDRQFTASGGTPPFQWRISEGQLPPGLALDAALGILTGTPTSAGMYRARLELSDNSGQSTSLELPIRIAARAVRFSARASFDAWFCRNEECFFRGGGAGGGGRGTNVAVIDAATGVVLDVRNFDTWAQPARDAQIKAMVAFLATIPDGRLVMIATGDANGFGPTDEHGSEPHEMLEALGSHLIRDYGFRNAWAMIFIKGAPRPLAEDLVSGEWPDLIIDTWLEIAAPACSYTLQPASTAVTDTGESGEISVLASSPYCFWEATASERWVRVEDTPGQKPYGMSNGRFKYVVSPNGTTVPRTAKVHVAGVSFDISQAAAPCLFTVAPLARNVGPEATRIDIEVWGASNCVWRLDPPPPWITILSETGGNGNGVVRLRIDANDTPTLRTATLLVASQAVAITQTSRCSFSLLPANRFASSATTSGIFTVTTLPFCPWTASVQDGGSWLSVEPGSGMGTGTVRYSVAANTSAARMSRINVGDRTFTLTQAGTAGNASGCISSPPGLTRWYTADGHAADVSGSRSHAVAAQNASYTEGLVGSAFWLDGSSYYRVPGRVVDILEAFTWEGWIKPLPEAALFPPVVKASTAKSGYALELTGSNIALWLYTTDQWQSSAAAPLQMGEWNHVAGVFDGTHLHIYVGGERRSAPVAIRGKPVAPDSEVHIGHDPSNTNRFFRGSIDEMSMYARALSEEEIRRIAGAGASGKCKPTPDHGINSIVNGADFSARPLAPGAVVAIFGSRFTEIPTQASRLPLPDSLGGLSVTVNGIRAPLYFAGPTQINVQIPYETETGEATLTVLAPDRDMLPFPIAIFPAAPSVFTSGRRCLAHGPTGAFNGTDTPAGPGSALTVYFSGQGAVRPAVASGASPVDSGTRPTLSTSITVAGQQAAITYIGLTVGTVGVTQVNFTVPALEPGEYPVSVQVGEFASEPCSIVVGSRR